MPTVWVDCVVVDRAGRRVGGGSMSLAWEGAQPGRCGGGDMGFGVLDDGTFELPCTPGAWTVSVVIPGKGDGEWAPIGRGVAVVPAAARASMTITLD